MNYAFFNSYKLLDKLCSDLFQAPHGVTCYIEQMRAAPPRKSNLIPGWHADLQQLVRLRHARNYLAHEGSFDEPLCTQADVDFLEDFRQQILRRTDPLARLSAAKPAQNPLQRGAAPRGGIAAVLLLFLLFVLLAIGAIILAPLL